MPPPEAAGAIDTQAQETVRVYIDVPRELDAKIKLRCAQLQLELGKRVTRKDYLERLVMDDVSKIKGASLREVSTRKRR